MLSDSEHVYEAALRLPESERLELVARLIGTMPDGTGFLSMDDPNLIAELDRRFADQEGTIAWKQLREQV